MIKANKIDRRKKPAIPHDCLPAMHPPSESKPYIYTNIFTAILKGINVFINEIAKNQKNQKP